MVTRETEHFLMVCYVFRSSGEALGTGIGEISAGVSGSLNERELGHPLCKGLMQRCD